MNEPHWYSALFRGFIGVVAIIGSMAALGGLYFIAVPVGNKDPLLLAIGIILGWGSSVISSEYGATSTGRKVVDSAVRNIERQSITADLNAQNSPSGTPDDPLSVAGAEPGSAPVKTQASKGSGNA